MTPVGIASVSIRESPLGMTHAAFVKMVRTGMERAAYRSVSGDGGEPPYPAQRIVWHVNPFGPVPLSQLVVNVFDRDYPYAYQEDTVSSNASPAIIATDVESMSERLLRDFSAPAGGGEKG
jgi:hypothetical protein